MEKTILKVTCNENTYQVSAEQGSSVNEMAFAVMVVIRTLIKANYIKEKKEFIRLVNKYFDDPQYQIVDDEKKEGEKPNEDN